MKTTKLAVAILLAIGAVAGLAAPDSSDPGSRPAESRIVPPVPPKGVAPLLGLARVMPKKPGSIRDDSWSLEVRTPKVVWQMIVEDTPKGPWCEVDADVEMVTLNPEMGYDESTQLSEQSQNRLVDIRGKRLSRDEALQRLAKATPVLVSPTGKMPDPFYLQCAKPDTLIMIFGHPSAMELSLLPTAKESS